MNHERDQADDRVDVLAADIRTNLRHIRARLAASTDRTGVEVVAVTKGHGPDAVVACLKNGLTMFGENYADELVAKANDPRLFGAGWTFQGRLQTNKINRLRPFVGLWQTVDSEERAAALSKRVPTGHVLVQLNLTGAVGRGGIEPDRAAGLIERARALGLRVEGVMGLGPDPDELGWAKQRSLDAFRIAVSIADVHDLAIRSLGMSGDFELAAEAGATMVRIGTMLLGPRRAPFG